MTRELVDYGKYFEDLQKVGISIKLGDDGYFEGSAAITSLTDDLVWLEMYGDMQPPENAVAEGAESYITAWTGGALCRCHGTMEKIRNSRQFSLRLAGPVKEMQRREFFRLDVSFPFTYSIPENQSPEDIRSRWETRKMVYPPQPEMEPYGSGYKVVGWNGEEDILPQRVNLSGGGLRLKTAGIIPPGTMLEFTFFLPMNPPRVVFAVAEALRSQEVSLSWERGTSYFLSMKFHLIGEKDRETIISFLFNEQRRELQMKNERVGVGAGR